MSVNNYRNFAYVMAIFISLVFGFLLPWFFSWHYSLTPWVVSLILLLLGFFAPKSLSPFYKAWMIIGNVLGFVNTRIILGIVFFLVFTPVAILLKLLKKDAMKRNAYKNSCTTYWEKIRSKEKEHMENIY